MTTCLSSQTVFDIAVTPTQTNPIRINLAPPSPQSHECNSNQCNSNQCNSNQCNSNKKESFPRRFIRTQIGQSLELFRTYLANSATTNLATLSSLSTKDEMEKYRSTILQLRKDAFAVLNKSNTKETSGFSSRSVRIPVDTSRTPTGPLIFSELKSIFIRRYRLSANKKTGRLSAKNENRVCTRTTKALASLLRYSTVCPSLAALFVHTRKGWRLLDDSTESKQLFFSCLIAFGILTFKKTISKRERVFKVMSKRMATENAPLSRSLYTYYLKSITNPISIVSDSIDSSSANDASIPRLSNVLTSIFTKLYQCTYFPPNWLNNRIGKTIDSLRKSNHPLVKRYLISSTKTQRPNSRKQTICRWNGSEAELFLFLVHTHHIDLDNRSHFDRLYKYNRMSKVLRDRLDYSEFYPFDATRFILSRYREQATKSYKKVAKRIKWRMMKQGLNKVKHEQSFASFAVGGWKSGKSVPMNMLVAKFKYPTRVIQTVTRNLVMDEWLRQRVWYKKGKNGEDKKGWSHWYWTGSITEWLAYMAYLSPLANTMPLPSGDDGNY